MSNVIGHSETEIGTVVFAMNAGNLEIRTHKRTFTVYEEDIKEVEGKFIFTIPDIAISGFGNIREIEIPADILKQRDEIKDEAERMKGNLCKVETAQGKVYFKIGDADQIIIKHEGKTFETKNIYSAEGKRVICLPELGFLELPNAVEFELKRIKREREEKARGLIYAGKSLLTGADWYKFNYDISNDTYNRIKELMEYFEPGEVGSLEGYLTQYPEKIEERLRIRNNLIADRKEEIEKQKEQAVKANKKLTEKLMKAA